MPVGSWRLPVGSLTVGSRQWRVGSCQSEVGGCCMTLHAFGKLTDCLNAFRNAGLPASNSGLPTPVFQLRSSDFRLPTKKSPSLHNTKSYKLVFISDKISRTCFPPAQRGLFIDFAGNHWLLLEPLRLL